MRHVILGAGNLGLDLKDALDVSGETVLLISGSSGFSLEHYIYPGGSDGLWAKIHDFNPDIIWNTVGAGGPSSDPEAWLKQMDMHFRLPVLLQQEFGGSSVILINFSTHYLNNDREGACSIYAKSKSAMEMACKESLILRVGSLYGWHKPLTCLPGKIAKKMIIDGQRALLGSENLITPTPTDWLAHKMVIEQIWLKTGLHSIGPSGSMSVCSWINQIATEVEKQRLETRHAQCAPNGTDQTYPYLSTSMVNDETDHCAKIWDEFGPPIVRSAILKVHS